MNAQFKTTDDLQEHYWSVIVPMVRKYNPEHGTDVKPWECVRFGRITSYFDRHPDFTGSPNNYTFALTVLEKPVFVGDKVFEKESGEECIVSGYDTDSICWHRYTLTPPPKKRTFMLNGVEFESPVKNSPYDLWIFGRKFYFESDFIKKQVGTAILILLEQARDKE